jgi:predicted nucleic acid-binding protein
VNAVYLETSAVLRWLLGEPDAPAIARSIEEATEPLCSALTLLEAQRALTRAERERPSRVRQIRLLRRRLYEASADWDLLEITPEIRNRAGEPFPIEPVRTLDAIHLATALQFARTFPGLPVLTFDQRILANLEALGLTSPFSRE